MASNEFYSPPEAKIEEKIHDPKSRKFAIAALGFSCSFLGIMLFFITAEVAFKADPVDFIFEISFLVATGICSLLTAGLLYPLRKLAWYFHAVIAPIAGLVILIAMLFSLNKIMNG